MQPWLLILLGILKVIVGLVGGLFVIVLILLAWNARVPPAPYITLAGKNAIRVSWFVRTGVKSALVLKEGDGTREHQSIIHPTKEIPSILGGRFTLCSTVITGLEPGVKYRYMIVKLKENDTRVPLFNGKHLWFASPLKQDRKPVKIAIFGDMQPRRFIPPVLQWLVMRQVKQAEPDVVVYLGDATMNGTFLLEWLWFFRLLAPVTSHAPLLSVAGNHDRKQRNPARSELGLDMYRAFLDYPGSTLFYGMIFRGIHFIALDFASSIAPGSEQYEFFMGELERERSNPSWTILFSHSTPFNTAVNVDRKPATILNMREHVVPHVEKLNAIWVGGHEHSYQRYTVNGIKYITSGATSSFHDHDYDKEHLEKWILKYHYTLAEVDVETMQVRAISLRGNILDKFTISRQRISPGATDRACPSPGI
ncbi:hypothetical protein GF325_12550 [Candidatus Bathyarchaeota archaeon]|nr:hypothetical protein [Candidatus Bathyarchaeota archaeon]